MFDLKNVHLQPTERKLFGFCANLWLMILSKREDFVHSLSLFFPPLFMHLGDSLQATNLLKNSILIQGRHIFPECYLTCAKY